MVTSLQSASCKYCRRYVVEPYCVVVEVIQNGLVIRKTHVLTVQPLSVGCASADNQTYV
jgi:hypothetical protein